MDKLIINGGKKLSGEVSISSSKNASLPILAATILYPGVIEFVDLPDLSDIDFFEKILASLGARVTRQVNKFSVDCSEIETIKAEYDLVRKMRASVLVLGPLLSRFGRAEVSLPGGCAIGTRPVDIHLKGMEQMGAKITIKQGYIHAECDKLRGADIRLDFPSVGATENIMMAAVYADGITRISNAAKEPEIVDHANFLKTFGAKIEGAGTDTITITGIKLNEVSASPINYKVIGDRIEAATFVIAGLMCNSEILVKNFDPNHLESVLDVLRQMGAKLEVGKNFVKVLPSGKLKAVSIDTAPYPGFPTDVQAQMMALMGISEGTSEVAEHIFENRFMHVPELVRMGMNVKLEGHKAKISGGANMSGAQVMCTDLRASAALVLTALVASGQSEINRIYHLDRGYEKLERKLEALGADVRRVGA